MSKQEKPRSWWYTLPGVITGVAAIITAVTGLIVAIKQTGWFDSASPQKTPLAAPSTAAQPPQATRSTVKSTYSVGLPDMRDYKFGGATFRLLTADMSRQSTEKDALQIRLRMTNHGRFDTNFWGQSFRLIVNEVPMAPANILSEIVPAESAKEGEVIFVIPHGTTEGRLKISFADASTEIPLALNSPR